jgi:hypothetical protein
MPTALVRLLAFYTLGTSDTYQLPSVVPAGHRALSDLLAAQDPILVPGQSVPESPAFDGPAVTGYRKEGVAEGVVNKPFSVRA